MYYRIRHLTRFQYSGPVTESLMEIRMMPRTEGAQSCLSFDLTVTPRTQIQAYRDYLGNTVHHFSIPGAHKQLQIVAESLMEVKEPPPLPHFLPTSAWDELDHSTRSDDFWEMLIPSSFTRPTPLLEKLMAELDAARRDDPLSLTLELNRRLYEAFEYEPHVTHVDSPIDDALSHRKGVCQDFAHIMIAILRSLRIPARYVSGYLHHRKQDHDRSSDGATHAWVEAWLPSLGWVGLDPTNNLIAAGRHIRVAIGRDYTDVPPTRGVFKGQAETKLSVGVGVNACDALPAGIAELVMEREESFSEDGTATGGELSGFAQQEQQQQQQ
jgi:transglutaminase-like putative cysteine protease